MFGYDENITPSADDLIYNTYLYFIVKDWAYFVVSGFKTKPGVVILIRRKLFVRVDRSQLISHGKSSIGRLLYKIHIWHSTADVEACWPFYGILSAVDGEIETWRKIVASNPEPKWKLCSQTLS
ncbi:dipeptidyl-peptidase 3 [Penicillium canescens]|nr:dipeptidyl-peptidase 3 [Penicillium canescens]KAJ6069822.1 dipeptidyl-peptidase 3 [Penicillium canescens]KAJ6182127.1 dipeptidyl-peptidase 3 [Penicillium canescens]